MIERDDLAAVQDQIGREHAIGILGIFPWHAPPRPALARGVIRYILIPLCRIVDCSGETQERFRRAKRTPGFAALNPGYRFIFRESLAMLDRVVILIAVAVLTAANVCASSTARAQKL